MIKICGVSLFFTEFTISVLALLVGDTKQLYKLIQPFLDLSKLLLFNCWMNIICIHLFSKASLEQFLQ